MKYLIVGLGNIGAEYELTRHNMGFLAVDALAHALDAPFSLGRHAFVAEAKYKGRTVQMIKPTTYMNLSGKAVSYWLQQGKVPLSNMLIVTDDIALPFGTLRMRGKGSNAGHNGLKNIEATLGTAQYARLRMGIGNEFSKGRQVDYVLGRLGEEEMKTLPDFVKKAAEASLAFCTAGLSEAMNQFNG
jgi:PTH1 family peptidyl-tRNA hydrolase